MRIFYISAGEFPVSVLAEELPNDEFISPNVDQPAESSEISGVTPEEQVQAANYLEPFLDLGIKLARTIPGWL